MSQSEWSKLGITSWNLQEKMQGFVPEVAITLGSGLGHLTEFLVGSQSIPYSEIPYCPQPSATGHEGRLWWGKLGDVPVAMLQGRVHCYDGYGVHNVVYLTRAMVIRGCKKFILTHAVGAVTKNLEPGDIVAVRSHIGLNCPDPTAGEEMLGLVENFKLGEFTPMGEAYSPRFLALAKKCALELGVSLHRGVSHFKEGRTYESEAEVEFMRRNGADVATMSTIPEVTAAVHMGAEVLDLALVTNMGAGLGSTVPLSHAEVEEVANRMKTQFGNLIVAVVKEMENMVDR